MDRVAAYYTLSSRWMFVADVQGDQAGATYTITLRCVAMYTVRRSFLPQSQVNPPNIFNRLKRWVAFWHIVLTWALNSSWRANRIPKKVGVVFLVSGRPPIMIGGGQVASAASNVKTAISHFVALSFSRDASDQCTTRLTVSCSWVAAADLLRPRQAMARSSAKAETSVLSSKPPSGVVGVVDK